jgi:hypothetical protein
MISDGTTKPVEARLIQLNTCASRVATRQIEQHPLAIAGQERHVERLVFVVKFKLELARLRHHDDGRLPDELVRRDVDPGPHHTVISPLGVGESAMRKESPYDVLVGMVYSGKLIYEVGNSGIELLQPIGSKQA